MTLPFSRSAAPALRLAKIPASTSEKPNPVMIERTLNIGAAGAVNVVIGCVASPGSF
jgi:hypothetical protein